MRNVIKQIFDGSKGILAADESTPTIKKRFDSIGVESTLESRTAYRKMLFSSDGIEKYIGGVILFEETLKTDGIVELLESKGIVPGIKVDKGAKDMPFFPGEKVTEGLDGLRDRLKEYKELGAKFAKWRGVLTTMASDACIHANAHALARYAALCQEQGIVPIVEPEILMDGVHSLPLARSQTKNVLDQVFNELKIHEVKLESIILKPNMVLSGYDYVESEPEAVAFSTINAFKHSVPASVPAIAFLSGGQPDDSAINNLAEMNKIAANDNIPWTLSFSYGRALQGEALKAWKGESDNIEAAQSALIEQAKKCHFAVMERG